MSKARASFTLIELLVVIAIIAILAAMLLPALSLAKQKSQRLVCLAEMHQGGIAMFSFASDNDRNLPTPAPDNRAPSCYQDTAQGYDLIEQIEEHLQDMTIWDCPTVPSEPITSPNNTTADKYSQLMYYAGRNYPWTDAPARVSDPRNLSSWPMIQDRLRDHFNMGLGVRTNHSFGEVDGWGWDNGRPSMIWVAAPSMAAVGGTNITYFDGHAAWVNRRDLVNVGQDASIYGNVYDWAVMPTDYP
jgi:prepilin-type N-terminal cleavage/methylation domain-containing protein/prepilin-type processing-associated H-X9-DG protein